MPNENDQHEDTRAAEAQASIYTPPAPPLIGIPVSMLEFEPDEQTIREVLTNGWRE